MSPSLPGLYESLLTERLTKDLDGIGSGLHCVHDTLRPYEAADRIALHLSQVIERALQRLSDSDRATGGVALARQIIDLIHESTENDSIRFERPVNPGQVLRAVQRLLPDGRPAVARSPETPLLDTILLTNAPNEPRVGVQILSEIDSADRIEVVMAFVRQSGIRPLLGALQRHCESGRPLRVLTTTYTGSTELAALESLKRIGAEIKVSYDLSATRLHAKSWVFHRASGYSTAYVGSSNLTHQAQVSGLEWNVRVSGVRNPDVLRQVEAIFESYWNNPDFRTFDPKEFAEQWQATRSSDLNLTLAPTELRPEPFQSRLLELIELSRQQGRHRNLLVAATGTGKTVMAALDYAKLKAQLPRSRLLFVAHREEILTNSRDTFRIALRDAAFGEDWVRGKRPTYFEHVFASIQSLTAADLDHLAADHYDIVIVDEFHHAAAASYERLLTHLKPRELLGLTATPERADGLSVLKWFDGHIAAELRLWDAIDQQRLCPFVYYGIHDGVDLTGVTWRRGTGYDAQELTNVYTRDHIVAHLVLKQVREHADNLSSMRALGFCVSVEHAKFMAQQFSKAGLASVAVWADTPEDERKAALRNLASGSVNVVFSVDLFNEGVDVPAVDTLLMLRPTESATLFLQQLGRGLRKTIGKTTCTVLDFVGQHRREFRYDKRFRALLGGTRKDVISQIESDFPLLPAGCHMELDRVASQIVLDSIRRAVPSTWAAKVAALQECTKGTRPSLAAYLAATDLDLADVYANNRCWSDLLEAGGHTCAAPGTHEKTLRRSLGRLLHLDDAERIRRYRDWLREDRPPAVTALSKRDKALLRMLFVSLTAVALNGTGTLAEGIALVWAHSQIREELVELLDVLGARLQHVPVRLSSHPDAPLNVHARYSRLEILAAMALGSGVETPQWREGVYWARDTKADLLAFTLDKSSGQFSPTTRYRDYAISPTRIHWESQSTTRAGSETGQRYQQHIARGSSVLLFARHNTDDRAFYFLGPATYVGHESEAPMAITWELETPLPGDLFASFAAAVA